MVSIAEVPKPEPALVLGGAVIGVPGASAQREYERRASKERANRTELLLNTAFRAALVGVLVTVLFEAIYRASGILPGALFGLVFFLGRVGPKLSTEAWSIGAMGELRTARLLDPLSETGYVVMHDLRISMSRANIDHLVIGPTGVFVVETKNIRGEVRLSGGDVRMGGRRSRVVDEVIREVTEVRSALGTLLESFGAPISALVCVHRADLPWLHRTVVGVRFVYPNDLQREITKRPVVLLPEQVAQLRAVAERRLPPRQQRAALEA